MATSLGSHVFGDKVENSSGYGSEDYSPVNENFQKTVRVGKNREELGIVLEPSKKQQKGVQIKEILVSISYTNCSILLFINPLTFIRSIPSLLYS